MNPVVASLGLVLCLAAEPPAREGKLDARPVGRFTVGDELEQTVAVARRSAYQVSGNAVVQAARYTLTSRLAVTSVKPDGGAVVRQTVTAARLGEADDALRPALADALKQAVGSGFELTVGPTGEATELRGLKNPLRVLPGDGVGGPSLRVWSVLDADAWRELAGLTLFTPDPAGKPTWDRPMGHDWGPLGGWSGRTGFTRKAADRVEFRHALSYRPPAGNAAGAELPLRIVQPRFAVVEAGGIIKMDAGTGRVTAAEETFRVRGTATVVFAGQAVGVELDETQGFEVKVRPADEAVLDGRPRGR